MGFTGFVGVSDGVLDGAKRAKRAVMNATKGMFRSIRQNSGDARAFTSAFSTPEKRDSRIPKGVWACSIKGRNIGRDRGDWHLLDIKNKKFKKIKISHRKTEFFEGHQAA